MKTLPLRELVRQPKSVKKLTAAGQSVRITDNGKPLWVVSPAPSQEADDLETEAARKQWMDEELEGVLREPISKVSAAKLIGEARQW